MKETLIVNLYAGAGAGKTTCAWEIAAGLKKAGIASVEYVPEYAKELIYEGSINLVDGSLCNQINMLKEQNRRLHRLVGKVDIIVTDCPLLLAIPYVQENVNIFTDMALDLYQQYNNTDFFIERDMSLQYEQEGRIHSLQESIKIDREIKMLLQTLKIPYQSFKHDEIGHVVQDMLALKRLKSNQ